MTILIIALYIACAVATYGWAWALARNHIKGDRIDRCVCAGFSLIWPVFVPLFGYGSYTRDSHIWRGWRIR